MRYYIADDDVNIVKILTDIIEESMSGEIVGFSNDGETALREIIMSNPDIILVDLLMPKIDGNTLVKEIKKLKSRINIIMISQVSDIDLITEAYNSGIEFFISKPINRIEVEKVTSKLVEKIEMENMLRDIKRVFKDISTHQNVKRDKTNEIKYILGMIGMLGEKGTNDIIKICSYLLESGKYYDECSLKDLCKILGENPKTIMQRIRRATKTGLTNLAHAGIEDYDNEAFQKYSNLLYNYENVKAEMDYLRGKRKDGGKVMLNKFFEGLILQCDNL